ncbi:hypothetical protein GCM10010387_37420 [Streptomyces inusitatus]|uniref:Thioester reductase (TE) domain-containing protein n=2 Tax=Streptomyces inusitatus TaxID=68221 RepID=A0A918QCC3_9ACTN|nr:hypothetical protein GCM10010387_37420 [Streptomyces inusitatus]
MAADSVLPADAVGKGPAVVRGSLGRPRFGLSEAEYRELAEVAGAVYHCGAWVNLVSGYEAVRGSNVTGTLQALEFADRAGGVPVHHVSTLGVLLRRFAEGVGPIAIRDRPVAVYRPGGVLPSTQGIPGRVAGSCG